MAFLGRPNYAKYIKINDETKDTITIQNISPLTVFMKSSDEIMQILFTAFLESKPSLNTPGTPIHAIKKIQQITLNKRLFEHSIFNGTLFRKFQKESKYSIQVTNSGMGNFGVYLNFRNTRYLVDSIKRGDTKSSQDTYPPRFKYNSSGLKYFSISHKNPGYFPDIKNNRIIEFKVEDLKQILNKFSRITAYNCLIKNTQLIELLSDKKIYSQMDYVKNGARTRIDYLDFKEELKTAQGLFSKKGDASEGMLKKLNKAYLTSLKYKTGTSIMVYQEDIYIFDNKDYENNLYAIMKNLNGSSIDDLKTTLNAAKSIRKTDINENIVEYYAKVSKHIPFEHQKHGITWLWNLYKAKMPGALLADDMGMGKTFQTIGFLTALNMNSSTNAIVVCPASAVGVWENEIAKFNPKLKDKVKIYSYQGFNSIANALPEEKRIKTDILILDEAQFIKNKNTLSSSNIRKIENKFAIILSGTPIENSIEDLYNILGVLSLAFFDMFSMLSGIAKTNQALVAELTNKIVEGIYLRRVKTKDQLSAEFRLEIIRTTQTPQEREIDRLIKDHYGNMIKRASAKNSREYYQHVIVALTRFMQNASLNKLLKDQKHIIPKNYREEIPSKAKKLKEIIQKIPKDEKIVIFTSFVETQTYLKEMFSSEGVSLISGSTPKDSRKKIIEDFQINETNRIIIIALKAGNSAITLHRANHVILYDLWWNPAVVEQAFARVYRIGQQKNVTAYIISNGGYIDENILDVINVKKEIIGKFTNYDGTKDFTTTSGDDTNAIKNIAKNIFA